MNHEHDSENVLKTQLLSLIIILIGICLSINSAENDPNTVIVEPDNHSDSESRDFNSAENVLKTAIVEPDEMFWQSFWFWYGICRVH